MTAEGPHTPYAWSSHELSPTIGRTPYHSFVDGSAAAEEEGLPFQSPIKEEEEEQIEQEMEDPDYVVNPTLARLNGERSGRIGRSGEIAQLVNGADMELMEPKMFDSLSNDYHSMGQMFDPLCKANKAVEVLCKRLEQQAEQLTGSGFEGALNEFVRDFMVLLSCGAYPAVASMMHILGQWNERKYELRNQEVHSFS